MQGIMLRKNSIFPHNTQWFSFKYIIFACIIIFMYLYGLTLELFCMISPCNFSYVSAMVPVKTMREHDLLQEVMVLFCETVQR